jgi:hypothetical protein
LNPTKSVDKYFSGSRKNGVTINIKRLNQQISTKDLSMYLSSIVDLI